MAFFAAATPVHKANAASTGSIVGQACDQIKAQNATRPPDQQQSLAGCTANPDDPNHKPSKGLESSTGYLNTLVDAFIYVGAAIAVIFVIVGGVRYITSTGDPTRIQQAKDTVLYAVIGLVTIILVRFIIDFVIAKVSV